MNYVLNRLREEDTPLDYYLSSRSKVYNLEPIGIGTPFVESLSSYISRLSANHNVTVSDFLRGVLEPVLKTNYIRKELSMCITKSTSLYINENNDISNDYVNALEILTGRNDLRNLTMLNWKGILSKSIRSPYRKWCPSCLNQMEAESLEIYEPLIWYLKDINKCDKHEIPLQDECPNCYKKLPFLHSRYLVGHCQYCGFWLGNQAEFCKESLSREEEFVYLNYKQLIANAPNSLFFPTKNFIPMFLERVIEELEFKNIAVLTKFLGYGHSTVRQWINGLYTPSHKAVIDIVGKLNGTVLGIIYDDNIELNIDITNYNNLRKKSIPKSRIKYHLITALETGDSKSLYKIAMESGFEIDTARRHFPLLCNKINEKYESYKKDLEIQKQEEIKVKLNECLEKEIPISFAQFLRENEISKRAARSFDSELCKKVSFRYKTYLAEQKTKRIEGILDKIEKAAIEIHQRGEYPSIGRVMKELGNKSVFLEDDIRNGWREIVIKLGYNFD